MRASLKAFAAHTVYVLVIVLILCCMTAHASRRSFDVNDKMPEFSGNTLEGRLFTYKHNQNKALMVVFLSPGHERSARAVKDINDILIQVGKNAEQLQTIIAIDKKNSLDLSSIHKSGPGNIHILLDSEYKLWGKFGIIAVPTVIISDTNDKVLCIRAGHGYNFAPVVQAYLNKALGIAQKTNPEEAGRVKVIANDTNTARLKRHLQMAKMLEQKGRIESAIAEIQKAIKLDPNSADAAIELGELFCRTDRGKEAIELVETIKTDNRFDKARLLLISGWAKRQTGDLENAEKFLLEAIKNDPKSTRAMFELGKVYQARQEADKAMEMYRNALSVIFDEKPGN